MKTSNVLDILSQHSSACKPRPAPDVQWPTSLHLVWTLRCMHEPVGFYNIWYMQRFSFTSWLALLIELSKVFHCGAKLSPRSGSAHSFWKLSQCKISCWVSTYPLHKGCCEVLRGIVRPFHWPGDFFLGDWQPCNLGYELWSQERTQEEEERNKTREKKKTSRGRRREQDKDDERKKTTMRGRRQQEEEYKKEGGKPEKEERVK